MGEDEGESSYTQPFRFFTALVIIHLFINNCYLLYSLLLIFKDKLIEIEKEMVEHLEKYLTTCLCSRPLWGLLVAQALHDIYFLRLSLGSFVLSHFS